MVAATQCAFCAEQSLPGMPAADPAVPRSLALLEGARQCLILARGCIDHGTDPRRHLRWAMTRIKRLPAEIAPEGDTEILAILADLTEYMCRELRSIRDVAGLATLERMYDLLREIRCAWLTEAVAAGPG